MEKLETRLRMLEKVVELQEALFQAAVALDWCADKFSYVHPGSCAHSRSEFLKVLKALGMTEKEFYVEYYDKRENHE